MRGARRLLLVLTVALHLPAGHAIAQPADEQELPPALLAQLEPDQPSQPLRISRAETNVLIRGFIAETTTTLTFQNDNERDLAGELVFPVPHGSTVAGYSLDIEGELVQAVPVERHQARIVFETEQRKSIDPGLVEWTRGNNFRTRVWPIPAGGSRTVQVQYISQLDRTDRGMRYHLPLRYEDPVAYFDLSVNIPGAGPRPLVAGFDPSTFVINEGDGGFSVRLQEEEASVTTDLVIIMPDAPGEDDTEAIVAVDSAGEHYFAIATVLPGEDDPDATPEPRADWICVLWDASFSRIDADVERELAVLAAHVKLLGDVMVEVIVVRDVVELPMLFAATNGDAGAIVEYLRGLPMDGGTRLDADLTSAITGSTSRTSDSYDYVIAFTDGLGTLGQDPGDLDCPLFTISSGSLTDQRFLEYIAQRSGGRHFDLARRDEADIARAIGLGSNSLNRFDFDEHVAEVCLSDPQPVAGGGELFIVTGRLSGDQTTVTMNAGRAGESTITLRAADAGGHGVIPRLWAQMMIDDLAALPEENHDQLLALGRKFNLVTPGTSLLVLETAEQHIEHRIEPPKSRPEIRAQYAAAMKAMAAQEDSRRTDKTEALLAMWSERVAWWEKEFDYPADYRHKTERGNDDAPMGGARRAPPAPREASDADGGGGGFDEGDFAVQEATGMVLADAEVAPDRLNESTEGARFGFENSLVTSSQAAAGPSIKLQPWDPDTPYLKALRDAGVGAAYDTYLVLRAEYAQSPAFFLDCAEFFFTSRQHALGRRVLTSILELELDDPALLRVVAHRLQQAGEIDLAVTLFEQVLELRPEEPQSYRDLALVLTERGETQRTIELLQQVVMGDWDSRFPRIEMIALMELNRILGTASESAKRDLTLDPRLIKLLDVDIRIILAWDADMTDIDLWVIEPSGEKCFYSHNRTRIGGRMSADFTGGYGPEEYLLRRAMNGKYEIAAHYFGSSQQKLTGATTIQATVIVNYGRPDEDRRTITMRLTEPDDEVAVGRIEFQDGRLVR